MATYTGYLKMSVVGSAGGQQITNTFYYGDDVGEKLVTNDAGLTAFGVAWLAQFGEDYLGEMPIAYSGSQVEVSMVDERNVTLSENTALVAFVGNGDIDQVIPGPGLAAIISLKTSGISALGYTSLRRSYIAWGPVPAVFVTTTGELTLTAKSAYANIAAMVGAQFNTAITDHAPVRIGRTAAPAVARVGQIVTATVKPFIRPRVSRFASDTGT